MNKESLKRINEMIKKEAIKFELENNIKTKLKAKHDKRFDDELQIEFEFSSSTPSLNYSGDVFITTTDDLGAALLKTSIEIKKLFEQALKYRENRSSDEINEAKKELLDHRIEVR